MHAKIYEIWTNALRVFIDFDQIFNIGEDLYFMEFVSYDQLVEFFKLGMNQIENSVSYITYVLSMLISNLRKQNEILLKIFLTILNDFFMKRLDAPNHKNPVSQYHNLRDTQCKDQYVLFLTQILYVETTYPQEFPHIIQILDSEVAVNGVELLFGICVQLQNAKANFEFKTIEFDNNAWDKTAKAVAKPFYDDYMGYIMQDILVYQKAFVALINRWN